jgi:hypothetical protein
MDRGEPEKLVVYSPEKVLNFMQNNRAQALRLVSQNMNR